MYVCLMNIPLSCIIVIALFVLMCIYMIDDNIYLLILYQ